MKESVYLSELFWVCLKIGLITFGGGYTMIPYFYSEILVKRKWFEEEEFIDILTVSQSVPGAISVNAAFNIGLCKRGFWGGLAAVLGMVIPAFLAIIILLIFFLNIRDESLIRKGIVGIITASAALICLSAIRLSKKVFEKSRIDNIIISMVVFFAIYLFDADIIWLILIGIIIGVLRYYHMSGKSDKENIEEQNRADV